MDRGHHGILGRMRVRSTCRAREGAGLGCPPPSKVAVIGTVLFLRTRTLLLFEDPTDLGRQFEQGSLLTEALLLLLLQFLVTLCLLEVKVGLQELLTRLGCGFLLQADLLGLHLLRELENLAGLRLVVTRKFLKK